ncbi:hypothetical protein [Lyngbya confervoides]|uniref:Uncharacterized protein n=1 Tax=Lyngbya confervoides BDU141951 TaxID=1574623 RepID=A0ABD4T8V8_9CYAN|nr:hypothetical protein [Lyngbya confervoides]MCM1984878.1 hypothetical protein [Lyngbya confervoides BDU141951]
MSAITKLFGAIFALLGKLLGGIPKLLSKKNRKNGFYLEIEENGSSAPAPKPKAAKKKAPETQPNAAAAPESEAAAEPAAAPAAISVAEVLNMPKPQVATIEPLDIPKFGPRRQPGANMKPFLDMAKTVKS